MAEPRLSKKAHAFPPTQGELSRSGPAWEAFSIIGFALSLLPSTFIAGGSIALLGGVASGAVAFARRRPGEMAMIGTAWVMVALCLLLSMRSGLPAFEIMKAGIGMGLFLTALVALPAQVDVLRMGRKPVVEVMILIICAAFLLEYTGVISMKEIGLVGWFETSSYRARFDLRPSGLYSEPSWLALSLTALNCVVIERRGKLKIFALSLSLACIVMSGSSIGLVLSALLLSWLVFSRPLPNIRAEWAFWVRIGLVCLSVAAATALVTIIDPRQIDKILHPTQHGSGFARFVAPLYYLAQSLREHPITGFGLSYMTERLIGLTGMAVLPINVLMELGLVGVAIYSVFIGRTIAISRSNILGISSVFICLMSLGLQYSPYQAILIVLFAQSGTVPFGKTYAHRVHS